MVATRSKRRPHAEARAEGLAEEGKGAAQSEQEGQQAGEGVQEGKTGGEEQQGGEGEGEGPATTEPATKRARRASEEAGEAGGCGPLLQGRLL